MRNSLLEPPPTVQIDNGTVSNITYPFPNTPQAYYQWFQSPVLSDGNHTAVVACPEGAFVDFAIVRVNVGNETRLAGTTIIVDSDSPSIIYSGNWSRNTSQLNLTSSDLVAYPYGNSTYSSSTPGDTFTFRFTGALKVFSRDLTRILLTFVAGTSCSIYGASFRNQYNAALDATYTIDGTTKNSTYYTYNRGDDINYLYYSLENLSAGDHTLIVNITAARGQAFTLDYITYAFGSLSLPVSNSTPLSSTSLGNPSAQPSSVQNPGTLRQSPTAAIVGGVIGVASLIVILGLWLFLRRRRANQLETDNTSQFVYAPDGYNYQNGMLRIRCINHYLSSGVFLNFRCKQPTADSTP